MYLNKRNETMNFKVTQSITRLVKLNEDEYLRLKESVIRESDEFKEREKEVKKELNEERITYGTYYNKTGEIVDELLEKTNISNEEVLNELKSRGYLTPSGTIILSEDYEIELA